MPTDRRFTGQREESSLGSLYDFNARFYSPYQCEGGGDPLSKVLSLQKIGPQDQAVAALRSSQQLSNGPTGVDAQTAAFLTIHPYVDGDDGKGDFTSRPDMPSPTQESDEILYQFATARNSNVFKNRPQAGIDTDGISVARASVCGTPQECYVHMFTALDNPSPDPTSQWYRQTTMSILTAEGKFQVIFNGGLLDPSGIPYPLAHASVIAPGHPMLDGQIH